MATTLGGRFKIISVILILGVSNSCRQQKPGESKDGNAILELEEIFGYLIGHNYDPNVFNSSPSGVSDLDLRSVSIPVTKHIKIITIRYHGDVSDPIGILAYTNKGSYYFVVKRSPDNFYFDRYYSEKVSEEIYKLTSKSRR